LATGDSMTATGGCPVCDRSLTRLAQGRDRYSFYLCEGCGLVTSLPIPTAEELAAYYDGFLFGVPRDEDAAASERELLDDTHRIAADIKQIAGLEPPAKVLDWGGGTGFYANAFAELGFATTMIDIDRPACDYAASRFAGKFQTVNADPVAHAFSEPYDIIFSNNVIEHCPDVRATMATIRRVLAPGGILVLTTPNRASWEWYARPFWGLSYVRKAAAGRLAALWKFWRTPWLCCDPPRHIHAFESRSLRQLLDHAGLDVIACFSEYSPTQYYCHRVRPDLQYRRPLSVFRIGLELWTFGVLWLLQRLDRRRLRGHNLIVFARPR